MQSGTAAVERVFREEYGRLIASLVRRFGDIDIAEEAAGEALVAALEKWPESGVPPNPGGWLTGQPLVVTATDADGRATRYPTLAGATVSAYLNQPLIPVDAWRARLGNRTVPLDGEQLMMMLPFKAHEHLDIGNAAAGGPVQRAGTAVESASFFQCVSFADALKFDDATMRAFANGKVVTIGSTAAALGDSILTPSGRFPGVFANLRFMDQLMRERFIARVPPWLDLALIVLLPLLAGFAGTQLRASAGVAVGAAVVVLYSLTAIALYGYTLHWMNLIHADAATILAVLFVALYRTITEGADKRAICAMFGKHVSPELVDHLLKSDDPLGAISLSGKRAKVTVFYSDIRGFTTMSE